MYLLRFIVLFIRHGFVKFIDFEHILMYIRSRKRDNVKEGVPLPIKKVEH